MAMAEPQLPEPTSATFSLPAEPLGLPGFPAFALMNATFLAGDLPSLDAPALPGDIALLLGSAYASCPPLTGMLGWELPQPMILRAGRFCNSLAFCDRARGCRGENSNDLARFRVFPLQALFVQAISSVFPANRARNSARRVKKMDARVAPTWWVVSVAFILLLPSSTSAFVAFARPPTAAPRSCPVFALAPSSSPLADAVAGSPDLITSLQQFKDSHTILIAALSGIAIRAVVSEVRYRIERPVIDKVGEKAREVAGEKARELTPNTDQIGPVAWAKLAACIALDLAGDASELYSFLGEFTDLAYAPIEAGLLFALFKTFGMARQCAVAHSSPDAATTHRLEGPGLPCGPNQAPSPRDCSPRRLGALVRAAVDFTLPSTIQEPSAQRSRPH